jgi:hypothetical protein
MIVASLLLILGAGVLLVLGLVVSSGVLLVASIAASLVAAVALLVGTRLAAASGGAGLVDLADPTTPARVARLGDPTRATTAREAARSEALVVVGYRHYHLPGCPDPAEWAGERRPLSEAEEMGLAPCPVCEPDAVIFVDVGRA